MNDESADVRANRFLAAILIGLLALGLIITLPFISGTIFALVLGYLLHPLYKRILRAVRWRPIAASLVLLIVLASLVAPILFISYKLASDASALAASGGSGTIQAAVDVLALVGLDEASARDVVARAIAAGTTALQAAAIPTLTAVATIIVNIAVFFFLLYFVLTDGERFIGFIRHSMPLADARCNHLFATVGARVRALFLGTFLVSVIQGVVAGLGWWYFGFPAPFFWGFVITFLAILPGGAPFIVLVPASIIAIVQGNTYAGVGLLVYSTVVVGTVDNLARPFIVSRGSDVHPAVVFLGTLGGIAAFGVTGFILGPLFLSMLDPVLEEWELQRNPNRPAEEPPPAPPPPASDAS